MPAAPGMESSAFLRSQSSRAASMSSPTCSDRRSMSSTSRSGSSCWLIAEGLPVLGLLTLLELLAQIGVLVRAPHGRVLAGLLGEPPLGLLAPLLLLAELARVVVVHPA